MNLAVGKGSLLRAANAAGRAKAEEKVNGKESGMEVGQEISQEAGELNKENDLAKEKKQSKNKSAKKQEQPESKPVKKMEQKQDVSENKAVKKSEQKQEQMGELSGKEKKISGKSSRKKSEEKHSLTEQKTYLLTVSVKELRSVPQEWRGSTYVCPNVSKLAESISRCGILEPLPVVQTGEKEYQLVGGSRRMQVIQMLGIAEVPVLVLSGSSQEDAKKLYLELRLADAEMQSDRKTQDKQQEIRSDRKQQGEKLRRTGLFGSQRIPEYLL